MNASEYTPVDPARFAEMLRDARGVTRNDHLRTFTVCWLLDPSYPRQDINAMVHIVATSARTARTS